MLNALLESLFSALVGGVLRWLRERRRERDLERLGYHEAVAKQREQADAAAARKHDVRPPGSRDLDERLHDGTF